MSLSKENSCTYCSTIGQFFFVSEGECSCKIGVVPLFLIKKEKREKKMPKKTLKKRSPSPHVGVKKKKPRSHVIIRSDRFTDKEGKTDIVKAKEKSVWASTPDGTERLRENFKESSTVYLYFTEFKSRVFCGVAKMKTEPSGKAPKGFWARDVYDEMFKIEWINKESEVHIPIEYENSRDTTVIPEKDGKDILADFMDKNCNETLDLARYSGKNTITRLWK
jgi:hypothetical protein